MNRSAKLYERAVLCHHRAISCSKEAEKEGWFRLASIWLILADSASANRIESVAAEDLTAE
jgi:hypothetical protein